MADGGMESEKVPAAPEREVPGAETARSGDAAPEGLFAVQRAAGNRTVQFIVGADDDRAEHDADRAADRAMAKLAPGHLRRSTGHGGVAPGADIGLEGGPLDQHAAAEIDGARGRGRRLESDVASTFRAALGRDVSDVRVHTDKQADRLARKMSATAFTTGSDIFFSQGAYRPHDESGQHLLAHELAHTQQPSEGIAQRKMIRRAVGFEFETDVAVKKEVKSGLFTKKVPLQKMEVIRKYDEGFNMEADENSSLGSTIEFVVEHVQENQRDNLVAALDKLEEVGDEIAAAPKPKGDLVKLAKDPKDLLGDATEIPRDDVYYVPPGSDKDIGLKSNPQVTGGISIDKVFTMMQQIGKSDKVDPTHKQAASELERMSPERPGKQAAKVSGFDGSDAVKGLATMLVSYLNFGSKNMGGLLNYAKLISNSTLIRTDFGSWFTRLPDEDKKRYLDSDGKSVGPRGQAFVDAVLKAAGMEGKGDAAVFERGIRSSMYQKDKGYNVPLSNPEIMISRQDWLLAITRGSDPLSGYWKANLKGTLEGLGRLGNKFDQVGSEVGTAQSGSGVIMEFRNMAKNIPYKKWKPLALGIFDYIVSLNAEKKEEGK